MQAGRSGGIDANGKPHRGSLKRDIEFVCALGLSSPFFARCSCFRGPTISCSAGTAMN